MSVGADNIIKIWDMKRFKCISEILVGSATGPLTKAVWNGNGQSVITASGGNIRIWDLKSEHTTTELNEKQNQNSISNSESRGYLKSEGPGSGSGSSAPEWRSRGLGSHAQTCTDLISTDSYVASSSKSGQIFRWSRD